LRGAGDGGEDVGAGDDPAGPAALDHHQDAVDVGIDHLLGQLPDRGRRRDRDRLRRQIAADLAVGGVVDVDDLPRG
jgi:hypothetical protein